MSALTLILKRSATTSLSRVSPLVHIPRTAMLMHTHTTRHSPAPHHQSLITRTLKIDHKNLSPLDVEKELFKMKRQMGAYYSKAAYAEALKVAKELNREVLDIMGSGNTVHASCLNDIGLMEKMLGNKEAALEKYKESLAIYEETVGKSHMSYVSTSSNIGVLYKSMADSAQSEEEYWKYLDLAEDILKKSLAARIDLHGSTAKEVLVNQNHLANILRCRGKVEEAESIFKKVLSTCRENEAIGNWDSVTALTLNNLGLLLKQSDQSRWPEAEERYKEAVEIRKETFGESHQDTIVSMHNLAEFYITRNGPGDQTAAGEIQQKILDILGEEYKNDEWSDEAVYHSLPASTKHGEVVQKVEKEQDEIAEAQEKARRDKMKRMQALQQDSSVVGQHSAPAGEVGGYYPGESTLPPPRSPVTAFLRVAKPSTAPKGAIQDGEDVNVKRKPSDDDVMKKIFDSMMKKHSEK